MRGWVGGWVEVHVEGDGIPKPDVVHTHRYSFSPSVTDPREVGLAESARTRLRGD